MKIIGLTGSIGMGKSFVADIFEQCGVRVFDSDAEIHNLLNPGGEAVAKVAKEFPDSIDDSGNVDRSILGGIVFSNPDQLKKLESILHPIVREKGEEFIRQAEERGDKMIVKDVPLLFETGANKSCDLVVVVSAEEEDQKIRVMQRDGMTEEKYQAINKLQLADEQKKQQADFVVNTSCDRQEVESQVKDIINKVLNG